jgi:myo-inositol 2-dehydrogenase / D-chiro-inositol 1-dehydrogenase
MNPVRVGILGAGFIAQKSHLPALRPLLERGEVLLQAFCDASDETLRQAAAEYGVTRLYQDHHEMLEREPLDALYVLLPPTCHTDAELIAAERGIPMLIEKPPTLDYAQALQFDAAIRRAGIVAQVGFMMRYYPSAEEVRRLLEGRKVRHANVQLFYSGTPVRYWTSRWELCGGSFVENTIHLVDLVRWWLGDVQSVSAFYVDRAPGEEIGDMVLPHVYMASCRFASGALANFTTSRCLTHVPVHRRQVTLVADDLLIDWAPGRVTVNDKVVWEQEKVPDPFALQSEAFVRAVRAGDPTAVRSPYSEALNSLGTVLAANESARRGGEPVDAMML